MTEAERRVIQVAREIVAAVCWEWGGSDDRAWQHCVVKGNGALKVSIDARKFGELVNAVELIPVPITIERLAELFKAERATCRNWMEVPGIISNQYLAYWDEARERYAIGMAEYCATTGLTTRKAERAVMAHIAGKDAGDVAKTA